MRSVSSLSVSAVPNKVRFPFSVGKKAVLCYTLSWFPSEISFLPVTCTIKARSQRLHLDKPTWRQKELVKCISAVINREIKGFDSVLAHGS